MLEEHRTLEVALRLGHQPVTNDEIDGNVPLALIYTPTNILIGQQHIRIWDE